MCLHVLRPLDFSLDIWHLKGDISEWEWNVWWLVSILDGLIGWLTIIDGLKGWLTIKKQHNTSFQTCPGALGRCWEAWDDSFFTLTVFLCLPLAAETKEVERYNERGWYSRLSSTRGSRECSRVHGKTCFPETYIPSLADPHGSGNFFVGNFFWKQELQHGKVMITATCHSNGKL